MLELAGRPTDAGSLVDPAAITSGVLRLTSWGWASLGVWLIIATPAVALVTTATEYHAIGDRRAVWTTVAVLVVLASASWWRWCGAREPSVQSQAGAPTSTLTVVIVPLLRDTTNTNGSVADRFSSAWMTRGGT